MDLSFVMMVLLSCLGDELFYLPITSALVVLRRGLGVKVLLTLLISMYLNQALKYWLSVPRPPNYLDSIHGLPAIVELLVRGDGPSLPSGHAQISSTFWTSLALNMPNKFTLTAATILPISIAYSRVVLGMHTPLDVVTALMIGYSVPLVTSLLDSPTRGWASRRKSYVELLIPLLLLIFSLMSGYPKLPTIAGLTTAAVLVHRLTLDSEAGLKVRLKASLITLTTLGLGYSGLVLLFDDSGPCSAITEFAGSLIIGLIAYLAVPVKLNAFKLRSVNFP